MVIAVQRFASVNKTTIFLGPDDGLGPFVPLASVTPIGLAVLTAPNSAAARRALGVAASVPVSVTPITLGGTGQTDAVSAARALGVTFAGNVVVKTANYVAQEGDGMILADATAGGFNVTIPRALGAAGKTKGLLVLKIGTDTNPVIIQDDAGPPVPKMALLAGGQAFGIVAVSASTVYAVGVQ